MTSLSPFVVAVEMMLLPLWVGVVYVRPATSVAARAARTPAIVVLVTAALVPLAAVADEASVIGVFRSQAVAVGWVVLLAGMAAMLDRLAGPRPAQMLTALLGWLMIGAMILAGPVAEMVDEPAKTVVVRTIVHANPLLVAERELGLGWLHQALTYRWTPLGESYDYLLGRLAWWKTLMAHVFVGSALLVFSVRRRGWSGKARNSPPPSR